MSSVTLCDQRSSGPQWAKRKYSMNLSWCKLTLITEDEQTPRQQRYETVCDYFSQEPFEWF